MIVCSVIHVCFWFFKLSTVTSTVFSKLGKLGQSILKVTESYIGTFSLLVGIVTFALVRLDSYFKSKKKSLGFSKF